VLVVDDNQDAANLLGALLTSFGCEVRVVHDGPAALTTVATFCPDIALIDIGLPEMDGLQLARRLRDLTILERTRLVAVTGYGQDGDRSASFAAGFSAHLVKPVDPDALRAVRDAP
jgi:CheY-like chemotaxis protein